MAVEEDVNYGLLVRYFVTGGAGFIGSTYVAHLMEEVEDVSFVTIFDKFTYAANERNYAQYLEDPRLEVIRGDVCNFEKLLDSMKNHDYVVHFAAESHVDRSISSSHPFVHANVLGTFNVLEASRRNHIRALIHVSTDEVYGSISEGSADENYPLRPNSPYSATKASSDLIALSYHSTHALDVRITRSCNNFGRYQYPEKIIPFFINRALSLESIPIYGDGKHIREWIHASDNSRAIQLVVEKGSSGEIYNIGSGIRFSNNEVTDLILSYLGNPPVKREYVEDRKGHDRRYALNSNKISRLGFNPSMDFHKSLSETVEWYRANQDWWLG